MEEKAKEKMTFKNYYVEFWGRAILVATVIALMMEWNNNFFQWMFWAVISFVLLLYAINLK